MARNLVVIGAQWGDEGKGKIVDLLTDRVAARRALPGRPQRRSHARHRRREDGAVADSVRDPAPAACTASSATAWCCRSRRCSREADALVQKGVPVYERLRISPKCPLILPSHVALDRARERASGANAIGTTGRGIGPAYEDKVARRAVRVADLFQRERFAARLGEVLDFHNFVLQRYFSAEPVDFQQTLEDCLAQAERMLPLVERCQRAAAHGDAAQAANMSVRGRAGRAARRRRRHLPVRDFVEHDRRRGGRRHRPRAARHPCRARHRQGVYDPRRRRARSRPNCSTKWASTCRASGTSSAQSPAADAAAAGSTRSRCAARSCTTASRASASPSSTCSTGSTRSASAPAIGSTARSASSRRCCRIAYAECEPVYEALPGWSEPTAGLTEFAPAARRTPAATSRGWRSWPACRSTSSRPAPTATETIVLRHPLRLIRMK